MPTPIVPTPIVYVTTWCKDDRLLYGSTLVFDSIRVGFPNFEVVVIENASVKDARAAIVEAARAADCKIRLLDKELPHWKIIESLCLSANRPFVILDPDIALWESVEDWEFGGALMAGRFIAASARTHGRWIVPRLHTSHLWFPDPVRLRDRISSITATGAPITKLFQPGNMASGLRWDTADVLYLALDEDTAPFTEAQLDAYDHLFAGSYLPALQEMIGREMGDAVAGWHEAARTDYRSLKGSWRRQQELLDSVPWSPEAAERPWRSQVLDHVLNPGWMGRLRLHLFGQADGSNRGFAEDVSASA
jgi:hypothetical protein